MIECICRVAVFILFSSHLIVPALATYRSRVKHYRENFDPAEADPRRNISCIGSSQGIKLPMLDNNQFNPNGLSMQQLCVKPQYGGGAQYRHAGAYCYDPLDPGTDTESSSEPDYSNTSSANGSGDEIAREPAVMLGKVVFDPHPGAHTSPQLQNPRFMQACTYRCFCNYGLEDVSQQPLSNHFPVELWEAEQGYELQIDIENDFTTPIESKMGDSGRGIVESFIISKKPQIDSRGIGYLVHASHMNLDPGNEIECTGNLPDFVFPPPFNRSDFASNQELCSVALSGGNKDVNAGGYCHRSPSIESTVWFSDTLTPRYDWTWGGGNFFATATLRYHCWEHCTCKTNPPRDPDTARIWRFMSALQLGLHSDGSVHMQRQSQSQNGAAASSSSSSSDIEILPPQQHGDMSRSPSGTCGPNRNAFCPKSWDEAAWGPIPVDPPNATDIVKPYPPKQNGSMGVCGNRCNGPSDCGTTEQKYSCSCAFPSASDARMLGLDPVVPVAVCVALFASAVKGGAGSGGVKGLGGRGLAAPVVVDGRGVPHVCRCEGGGVGVECCKINDERGLVR